MNPGELCNYPLMVTLDRYDGGFDTFGDQSDILCVPNKIEERNES